MPIVSRVRRRPRLNAAQAALSQNPAATASFRDFCYKANFVDKSSAKHTTNADTQSNGAVTNSHVICSWHVYVVPNSFLAAFLAKHPETKLGEFRQVSIESCCDKTGFLPKYAASDIAACFHISNASITIHNERLWLRLENRCLILSDGA